MLRVDDDGATLLGIANARVFWRGQSPVEVAPTEKISTLL
jgi:hypothetical protein